MKLAYQKSLKWLKQAKKIIPTASQTYSKGYKYYCEGAAPVFIDRGKGSHVWDVDDNEFIDTVLGLGAITIGYQNAEINLAIQKQLRKGISFTLPSVLEVELAQKLTNLIPCAEMVRFVKNGSDATTAAVRLARAHTGRDLILSCGYHGWHDWSIGITENNRGVPECVRQLTLEFRYNDMAQLSQLVRENAGKIAAVIMEPVQLELPREGYLEAVRELTRKHGIVLIFDEVVTGFRYDIRGAQGYFGVTPDLACFGKGMANGASIAALTGKAEIMKLIDENVFVSMTFGGDTLALASALATLKALERKSSYKHLWKIEKKWVEGVNHLINRFQLSSVAYTCRFPAHTALLFRSAGDEISALDLQSLFQQEVLKKGVIYLGAHNFCLAYSEKDIDKILTAYEFGFHQIKNVVKTGRLGRFLEGEKIRPVFARN